MNVSSTSKSCCKYGTMVREETSLVKIEAQSIGHSPVLRGVPIDGPGVLRVSVFAIESAAFCAAPARRAARRAFAKGSTWICSFSGTARFTPRPLPPTKEEPPLPRPRIAGELPIATRAPDAARCAAKRFSRPSEEPASDP
mmetsp:Transcript_231/g.743  ORF Transcript_231/g.743 Transcript_231/m.743 type:complete len:141 (-) Transcript_231:12-434(-)